jgi:DNA-binding transcriptional MerR regulator
MGSGFSTQEVSELTGASIRQIDHWARTGLVKPSERDAAGRGSRRRYSFRDVVAVRTVQNLRERYCPLQQIRATIKYLEKNYPNESNAAALARVTLLTDGRRVYLLTDEQGVMEVVTKQLVWSVPLGRLILDTRKSIDEIPTQWTEKVEVRGQTYHLEIERDAEGGGYTVQCRELPAAIEQGRTPLIAMANGKDAIESVLNFMSRRKKKAGLAHVATR